MEHDATLWKAWHDTNDETARDRIIQLHLPLVHHVARTIRRRLRGDIGVDELVNAGCIGLLHAVDSYEPERGLAFSTYAVPRIRGAILDELRRTDTAARTVRKRQRMIAIAERALAAEQDGKPDAQATAKRMDIDVETLFRWKTATRQTHHISLDAPTAGEVGVGRPVGVML
jgi:RNA polymerase sigma factor for flagellar operon FliA